MAKTKGWYLYRPGHWKKEYPLHGFKGQILQRPNGRWIVRLWWGHMRYGAGWCTNLKMCKQTADGVYESHSPFTTGKPKTLTNE